MNKLLKTDTIKLRFVGNNIDPTKITFSELGDVLSYFEKALKNIVFSYDKSHSKEKDYYLTLSDITKESAGFVSKAFTPNHEFDHALLNLKDIIKSSNGEGLNDTAIKCLNSFSGWLRNHGCDAECYYNNVLTTEIPKETKIIKPYLIREITTLYGKVIHVGNEKSPKAEFRIENGQKLNIQLSKELAQEIAKYLYKEIALIGESHLNPKTLSIAEFELHDFIVLSKLSEIDKIKRLKSGLSDSWEDIDDPIQFLGLNE
ncbi:MAG: hypothetical protein H6607_12245 [Flavobacteriales bacterium]|nr:hypothetical protein [Flavobacteriales bacterium]